MARDYDLVQSPDGVDLVVTGPWSSESERVLESRRATGLVLNYAHGFQERDLGFIRGLRLERLTLLARTIEDLSPLYTCSDTLVQLSVTASERAAIELDRFPRLRRLSIDWHQAHRTLRYATHLDDLYVGGFAEQTLEPLATLSSLSRLRMKDRPSVQSLDGFENFPWLQELEVAGAQQLVNIDALARYASPVLNSLSLQSSKRIVDLAPISACTALTALNAADCGDLLSAEPLRPLNLLEGLLLYESTRFIDGDLSAIAQLPRLRTLAMANRSHYTPSVRTLRAQIGDRE